MRKNFALLGATLAVCLVAGPAWAGDKLAGDTDVGNSFKLASLALEKTDAVAAPEAIKKTETEKKASRPANIVKKKRVKKRVPERLFAKIDLTTQTMQVMVDGKLMHSWQISSGRKGFHTPRGSYKPYYMNTMHYSKKYDNAPMPHSVFYSGGFAVHATSSVNRLGSPASHGCTRLAPANAKKFFNLVLKYKKAGTRIKIVGSTPATRSFKKRYAKAPRAKRYNSWDNFTGYGGNYVGYSVRSRPASAVRRIRIGRPATVKRAPTSLRKTSQGRIFEWEY